MTHAFYDLGLLQPSEIYLGLEYDSGYPAAPPAVKPETNAKLAELIREGLDPGKQIFVPTYSVLKHIFEEQAHAAGADSLFVFMLSTHGFEECYASQDSRVKSDRTSLDPCLSVTDLRAELTRPEVRVNRRLMLIDACRERKESGARNQGTLGVLKQDWAAWQGIEGLAVLLSATDGELSFEGKVDPDTKEEIRNGAFTHFLLRGLIESQAEPNQAGYMPPRAETNQSLEIQAALLRELPLSEARTTFDLVKAELGRTPPAAAGFTRSASGRPIIGVSTTEVTQGTYRQYMGKLPEGIPDFLTDDSLPVVMVSYKEAAEFCAMASIQGYRLRLPTVSEWRMLCTVPSTTVGGAVPPQPGGTARSSARQRPAERTRDGRRRVGVVNARRRHGRRARRGTGRVGAHCHG